MIELIQKCLHEAVEIDSEAYVQMKTMCYELTDSENISDTSTPSVVN